MEYQTHTLANGLRLVHLPDNRPVAYCGLLVNTGSRDEKEHEHGIAHFIEHVIFKGTTRRKAYHILSRMDDVGGEINAYTTKEETAFYTAFLNPHYDRALDLLSDIVFHSIFPVNELEKEKAVIIDEINSCKDNPADLIFDDFEELVFHKHPIGRNILGTPRQLQSFTRDDIFRFMNRNYHTDQMVICSTGQIKFSKLVRLVEKHFGDIPERVRDWHRDPFTGYRTREKINRINTHQAHCIMGNIAYNVMDQRRLTLMLLNNLLGGQGLNSRLNLSLREKHAYAYDIESTFTPYFDTGVLSVYFGTDKEKLDKSIKLVHYELNKLRTKKLGTLQLRRAKNQILGQIAIASENRENLILTVAKSFLLFNRFDSYKVISRTIESITSSQLIETANEILDPNQLSTLIFQ
ncbi:MAG: insulinase family protein [Bacteroidales bacterium]|nr:insulinase family protein [Bacteroidales bacterium]